MYKFEYGLIEQLKIEFPSLWREENHNINDVVLTPIKYFFPSEIPNQLAEEKTFGIKGNEKFCLSNIRFINKYFHLGFQQ